jgi:collagen triple helix repeat protein
MLKRRLKEPFGKAGLTVAVIALVFAMLGGAYAASNSSGGGKATASAKAKQGKQGKPGKTGPQGPAGPAGAPGAKGDKGDTGAAGANGTNGTNGTPGAPGTPGTSVTNTAVPTTSATCNHQGGAEFKVGAGTPTTACNGETGFTETLPSGKTETGTWNADFVGVTVETDPPLSIATFSFPIPLASTGEASFFNQQETEEEEFGTSECAGSVAAPSAPPGRLCVYTAHEKISNASGPLIVLTPGATGLGFAKSGAILGGMHFEGTPEAPAEIQFVGTWAVTAP